MWKLSSTEIPGIAYPVKQAQGGLAIAENRAVLFSVADGVLSQESLDAVPTALISTTGEPEPLYGNELQGIDTTHFSLRILPRGKYEIEVFE